MKIYQVKFGYNAYYYNGKREYINGFKNGEDHIEADSVSDAVSIIEISYPNCTVKSCAFVCVVSTPMDGMPK